MACACLGPRAWLLTRRGPECAGGCQCGDRVFQQLKDDAVALVDVIAPPDFVLDSPIARADGEVRTPSSGWDVGCPRGWQESLWHCGASWDLVTLQGASGVGVGCSHWLLAMPSLACSSSEGQSGCPVTQAQEWQSARPPCSPRCLPQTSALLRAGSRRL